MFQVLCLFLKFAFHELSHILDVLGVLEEGEIHIKCSQRYLLRLDGQKSDRITGDVLVCLFLPFLSQTYNNNLNVTKGNKKPMQASNRCPKGTIFTILAYTVLTPFQVKAVFKPELDDYVNVIVFSIKGSRSLASMLGTGKRSLYYTDNMFILFPR